MTYDIIIVGGGPAGTTAAMYAARAGLRTLLLEKARFPRDKICGDAISGKAVTILDELGLVDGVRRLPGAEVRHILFGSPDHIGADIDLSRAADPSRVMGFVTRRADFDAFLFAAAIRSGVECREGFSVEDLMLDATGSVCGVRGRSLASNQIEELAARIVLGADGYRSIVARRAGLYAHDPEHTATGVRAYYRNVSGLSDRIELHYVDAVRPGYLWIFPLDGDMANVGIGMLGGAMKRDGVNLVETLDRLVQDPFLAPRLATAVQVGRTVGWQLPLGSRRRPASGDGYMLLGDAAGLIDPFTGEGIGNAMFSGRRAVAMAVQALTECDTGAASLSRYDDALWAEVGDELAVSARLQRIARFRPLLEFTIRKAARSPRVRDMICAMIANEFPRKALTRPAFYFDLLFR
ncbi:geranylgeranyl reductase family protein [Stella humosa]|uniref:Geranylgeranyl reductase family protein n=1 Tax=Stella humosa TaxID=94 RepID=A0A3N1KKR5_9PROT|nr:NAD(P)/FAD-dependent oxidoreductase [Stella humosa]ROP81004.1 geranylgeranyl reductase family protein [Stella humosa]BBK29693.1 geranylgeranyl hydrogenase BchP [Stella humosa]